MVQRLCFGTLQCNPKQSICKSCKDLNKCIVERDANCAKEEKRKALQILRQSKASVASDRG